MNHRLYVSTKTGFTGKAAVFYIPFYRVFYENHGRKKAPDKDEPFSMKKPNGFHLFISTNIDS